MYTIHTKKELSTLRGYKEGDSYEQKSIPLFSCTVHYISDDEIYICDARGEIPARGFAYLVNELRSQGVKILRYERHNKMKTVHL